MEAAIFIFFLTPMKTYSLLMSLALAWSLLAPTAAMSQDIAAGKAKAAVCAACHGEDGNAVLPIYPNLAGQSWRYIYIQLKDFKEGRRHNDTMSALAATLSREDMINIANYFAAQPVKANPYVPDETKIKLGKAKADETLCSMCHLGGFSGQNEIPRVAGQQYEYVMEQLRNFKSRTRTNDAGNMTSVAQTLTETDMENLANYIVSLR